MECCYVDVLPGHHPALRLGLSAPVWQKDVGRTRPALNHVKLEKLLIRPARYTPDNAGIAEALARLRDHGRWINRLAVPYFDAGGPDAKAVAGEIAEIKARLAAQDPRWPGFGADREAYAFSGALEEAFGFCRRDPDGLFPGSPDGRPPRGPGCSGPPLYSGAGQV